MALISQFLNVINDLVGAMASLSPWQSALFVYLASRYTTPLEKQKRNAPYFKGMESSTQS